MKNILFTALLMFFFFEAISQTGISIGVTPSLILNFNTATKASQVNEFKIKSNFPSLKGGINILFERKKIGVNLGLNYLFSKYGWKVTYEETTDSGSIYNLDELALSTESLSADLVLQFLLTPIYHHKANLYFGLGGGYSIINHTQLAGHYRVKIHNSYFSKILYHEQAKLGSQTSSAFIKVGTLVQTSIKRLGKINYGIYYSYYLNTLPEMKVDLIINGAEYMSVFETRHSYLEVFITYYVFNLWKRGATDRLHKVQYK